MPNTTETNREATEARDNVVRVQKPLTEQSSVLAVDPGTQIHLDFSLDQVEAALIDGNLVFVFETGEQLELENFEEMIPSIDLYLQDGSEVDPDQFAASLGPSSGDEPAAGGGPGSGGAGEYEDYLGVMPDGIDRLGTLGPREFGGGNEEPDIRALDVEEEDGGGNPPPEETDEGPQANPDVESFLVESLNNEQGGKVLFYDIDEGGNVLDNDVPEGVLVTGFTADGVTYGSDDLGNVINLGSGARFSLSDDGAYRYVLDNTESISPTSINPTTLYFDVDADPAGTNYDFAQIRFDAASLDFFDLLAVTINYHQGDPITNYYFGNQLAASDGVLNYFDPPNSEDIKDVQAQILAGDVVFDSLEVVDTSVHTGMEDEVINYTIADSDGDTSSSTLTFTFSGIDVVPPPPEAVQLSGYQTTPPPETVT